MDGRPARDRHANNAVVGELHGISNELQESLNENKEKRKGGKKEKKEKERFNRAKQRKLDLHWSRSHENVFDLPQHDRSPH